ncbi:MAG: regulatory protein RecX [Gammaproteobacteria bacterium]|nr:regulatory protein RecX [Gammaproteobacteria bacterium]
MSLLRPKPKPAEQLRSIRETALNLLARREHSALELQQKLAIRGYPEDAVESLLQVLQKEHLQSDERFTESYIRYRISKGFGPIKISNELVERGLAEGLIQNQFEMQAADWSLLLKQQRQKKFGSLIPSDYNERMRQARFLQTRGFPADLIMQVLGGE